MRGRLMLVTDRTIVPEGKTLADVVRAAVAGGVDLVQVREKDLADQELLALTLEVLEAVRAAAGGSGARNGAQVVVNGSAFVARQARVGLHLPEAMALPEEGRGAWPLWGRSVHDVSEARKAAGEGPGYLVVGSLFPTTSHAGAPHLGEEKFRGIVHATGAVPVLAIGGITPDRVADAMEAGAAGVAVRSDIMAAADPERAARELRAALDVHEGPRG
jgi:thiamine-phosphate pyrophosphorylase